MISRLKWGRDSIIQQVVKLKVLAMLSFSISMEYISTVFMGLAFPHRDPDS